ncbi:V/A-type H+-transporting ATPase subunit B [Anaerosphaera aminiphila DSM 21120]|uniref:V-type ATP synthase beta chain n=1 Tax=Anaerosphaera aminiphila DSM 21120 TaxID=1120995 RepID=A0A1M5SSW6_9FIRM|nr:V-type ATP synthase subunit B [Anaerosphaera aminiphila]SHH41063.1 V/A-type H+-transporting ATPase subunit B [Anaerosphaera aminiphila DSM 21120]
MKKEYLLLDKVEGSLIELSNLHKVSYGEVVRIKSTDKKEMIGQVIKIDGDSALIQVFGDNLGVSTENSRVLFESKPFEIPLSKDILGRVFDGIGRAIDKGGDIYSDKFYNVNGRPINPVAREYPRNFIQTGISSIDALMTLIRGQKLPIFSGSGLPHDELAAQIVRQAKVSEGGEDNFAIVFAAIGVKHDEANYFRQAFNNAGVSEKVVMYINYADDPIMERLIAPKCALTAAEYLAYEENKHVLVIMTDITSYGEALREVSSSREEVPSRKGYPGHLYSDLAMLYERAGMIKGINGSVTLIPILTMPNDDITHPIPDLTGYITEGQIVLSRDLDQSGVYPPINVLPSLSRLMKDGIGEGFTREDHPDLSSQLFASYSKVQDIRALAQIIGSEDLSDSDKKFLEFGAEFENKFLSQSFDENRSMNETLDLGWKLLRILPEESLDRISPKLKEKYLHSEVKNDGK